ncbi:MAG: hypothetical protein U0T83_03880 [Bacteriovoracaceae bacterium]
MIFEQKYLTLSEIEIEHTEALNALLAGAVPSFDWLKNSETPSDQIRNYYYLFFGHTGNTPVGFFTIQVSIPTPPQTFLEKLKKKVSTKKELVKIDSFLKGVSGSCYFCQPQYENDIQKKIETIIHNHINEFDKNRFEIQLNIVVNKKLSLTSLVQTRTYAIPKMMLKIHNQKKEVKNSLKAFGSSWEKNVCTINITEQTPQGFLQITLLKNASTKAGFCLVSTNVDLNQTHFYNIYLNALDYLYDENDLSKIYFINFNNSISSHFETLNTNFLEQLGITSDNVYLYSNK